MPRRAGWTRRALFGSLGGFAILCIAPGSGLAEVRFAPAAGISTLGTIPLGAASADLNRDGKQDLVVANRSSGNVSVLLGDGSGGFGAANLLSAGSGPGSVAVADFDRDGKPDLAVANEFDDEISILLGDGNGGFGAPQDVGVGDNPQEVAVADLDRDGNLDLVTPNLQSDNVSVLLGNGNGTFGPTTDFDAGSTPAGVAIGDLDRDGVDDLVTANFGSGNVSVLVGNGDGTFGPAANFALGTSPDSIALGDFDRDGKLDLATANTPSDNVSVMLGNGDGSFDAATSGAVGDRPHGVAIDDLDRDGSLDLFVANEGTGMTPSGVSVLRGNGDGTFAAKTDFPVGLGPTFALSADFNRDGRPDVLSTNASVHNASLLINTSPGFGNPLTFAPADDYVAGGNPWDITAGDLDLDGDLDLVAANEFGDSASILLGDGSGAFTAGVTAAAGTDPRSVAIADVNRDGLPDLATASAGGGDVSVLIGHGDGTFDSPDSFDVGGFPAGVAISDLNRDGSPDLAAANLADDTVSVRLGNGDGTFGAENTYPGGSDPYRLAVGDLDADGDLDLATANVGATSVSVILGDGNGSFATANDYAAGTSSGIVAADLSRDGALDLATADANGQVVWVLDGVGDGTFDPGLGLGVGSSATAVASEDFNRDGKPDLASANIGAPVGSASVFLGNGDGSFQPHEDFPAGSFNSGVVAGDFNRDGKPDLATVDNDGQGAVSVLLNTSDTTPPAPTLDAPADGSRTNDQTPTLSGVAGTAPGDDLDQVTIEIYSGGSVSGSPLETLTPDPEDGTGAYSADAVTELSEGTYTARVLQDDDAGNTGISGPSTFEVDLSPPTVTLTTPADGSRTNALPTFDLAGIAGTAPGDDLDEVVVQVDGPSGESFTLDPSDATGAFSGSFATGFDEGLHTAVAFQEDGAGNIGMSPASTFFVDLTAPVVTLTTPADGSSAADPTPQFSGLAGTDPFDDLGEVRVEIYAGDTISGSPFETLTADPDDGTGAYSASPVAELDEGTYTARALQGDDAGNTGLSPPSTFTVDTTAPDTQITGGPADGSTIDDPTPTFVFATSEPAGLECSYDAGAAFACSSPHTPDALSDGAHTLRVTATDAAGNVDASPATRTFTVDTSPPVAGLTRSIRLKYRGPDEQFRGRVRSDEPTCLAGKVNVLRTEPGKDPKVGSDRTNSKGRYAVPEDAEPGRYYAKLRQSEVAAGICPKAVSKRIRVG